MLMPPLAAEAPPGIERWQRGSRVGGALRVFAGLAVVVVLALIPYLQGPSATYK